jgi:TatD DNase family protein
MFFDTHTHLNLEPLYDDYALFIHNMRQNNVKYALIPGVDVISSQKALAISNSYPFIFAAYGIHPHEINATSTLVELQEMLSTIKNLIETFKPTAIGECGLDYHLSSSKKIIFHKEKELQKYIFIEQIHFANTYLLPLIIHCREAKEDCLTILAKYASKETLAHTVLHCCEAEEELLNFIIKNNMYLGVDGDVTYNQKKQELIEHVPIERLVLETDAPFLTPEPIRSTHRFPNEPANIVHIAQKIAKIKAMDIDGLAKITQDNAFALFKISPQ